MALRRGFVYVPPANEAPQHDLDGNLIDDGRWVYTWDAENRLISMTQKVIPVAAGVSTPPARTRLEFAYDYKNRRIAKKVFQLQTSNMAPATWRLVKDLRFVYDGYQMIAELDATFATGTGVAGITPTRGVVRTYLWGPDVSGTMTGAGGVGGLLAFTFQGDSYYPISDANGNICAIHAPGIDQVIRFDYDPFGNRLTNTGPDVEICPMGFSSKYTDSETGLVDYGLRIYSPMMGRFLSRDPIEENGGINLYGFVENDPVNRWDYLGLVEVRLDYSHPNLVPIESRPITPEESGGLSAIGYAPRAVSVSCFCEGCGVKCVVRVTSRIIMAIPTNDRDYQGHLNHEKRHVMSDSLRAKLTIVGGMLQESTSTGSSFDDCTVRSRELQKKYQEVAKRIEYGAHFNSRLPMNPARTSYSPYMIGTTPPLTGVPWFSDLEIDKWQADMLRGGERNSETSVTFRTPRK